MAMSVGQLKDTIEAMGERTARLREENYKLQNKLSEARRELKKLRAWWRALQSLACGE